MRRLLPLAGILLALPALILGAENFPPPEFTTHYQHPVTSTPLPRADLFGYIDIGVLALALALSAWFVHTRRSRRDLLIVTVFSLAYFGFYRNGCVCAVGAVQNVVLAAWQHGYALPVAVGAFFLLPLLLTLFVGRVFCAAVCPLGAAQEIVLHRPVKVPAWLEHPLSVIPYLYLGIAVLYAATASNFFICKYDPFVGFFRFGGSVSLLVAGAVLLLIGTRVGRPYCRYLCPYGVLLRWLAPLTRWRVAITPRECVNCHLCADACPYGAIRPPTPPEPARSRFEGRGRLALTLALLPVFVVTGGWLGSRTSGACARLNPVVTRADAAWQVERNQPRAQGQSSATLDPASPNIVLYRQALAVQREFDRGTLLLGAWIGLVLGIKLVLLSIRRRVREYEIDQAACYACGRCYAACPVDRQAETPSSALTG